ncbi:MAG: tRNA (adenosine(37)-N6)-threonylcarbamoyltransferase complex transferase subunit TsaD, partial [Candidatus Marinimicrobia bacterium]|nr:tRNA (adenosine(37)-N6)-threonylcarbamoyltransferase complex transferase subunit TsaD [Candidatus Neomarinimicrobiota bacterium]
MIVLGIETSCDDTGAAIVDSGKLRSNVVYDQQIHQTYGGVVPEIAARMHEQKIIPVVTGALQQAGCALGDLDGIAVTYGPGLAGALVVGLNFAKGLAQSLQAPFIGINHMEGHLWANFLERPLTPDQFPFICLLVSGGHTHLWLVAGPGEYTLLGRTLDDAAGEAFDKGARLLGLGYPGGPAIQHAAVDGDALKFAFPRPKAESEGLDYSFSGLKTALFYQIKRMDANFKDDLADLAASYQQAIIDSLMSRLVKAVEVTGIDRVCIAGGVSANNLLRQSLDNWSHEAAVSISYPAIEYCTDNAAMI